MYRLFGVEAARTIYRLTTIYAASWKILSDEDPAKGVCDVSISLSLSGKRNEGKEGKMKKGLKPDWETKRNGRVMRVSASIL